MFEFIEFEGGVTTAAGAKLLAVNPNAVAAIYSQWNEKVKQNTLTLHLINNRQINVIESDAPDALKNLGLAWMRKDWYLNLEKDIS